MGRRLQTTGWLRITEFHPGASMAVLLEGQGMMVIARFEVSPIRRERRCTSSSHWPCPAA